MNVYYFLGNLSYGPKEEKLESFEKGPINGTFYINGELWGLSFLNLSKSPSNMLYGISENIENLKFLNYSNLIPNIFTEEIEGYKPIFVPIGNVNIEKIEEKLSLELALLCHTKQDRKAIALESYYQNIIGLDVSIEKGCKLMENKLKE